MRDKHARLYDRERNAPFLHFRSRDIDTFGLTSTTHSKVDIKRRQPQANVALGNDIEGCRVVEDVVVKGEFATINTVRIA